MSNPNPGFAAESPPIPKISREILAGIKSLENWKSRENDEYLKFFEFAINELEEESNTPHGSFPLLENLALDDSEQEALMERLTEVNEISKQLADLEPEDRVEQFSESDINDAIEDAKYVYRVLDSIEDKHSSFE